MSTIEKQLADALRDAQATLAAYEKAHDQDKGSWSLAGLDEAECLGCAASVRAEAALAAYDARPVAGDEQVERVARAIDDAKDSYSHDFGLHDYTSYGRKPAHVMRDYRIREGSQAIFESADAEEALAFFMRHKRHTIARAAIAALPPQVSPELIEKLGKLANYLTEQGEYEACDLIDTVVERVTPKAKG